MVHSNITYALFDIANNISDISPQWTSDMKLNDVDNDMHQIRGI